MRLLPLAALLLVAACGQEPAPSDPRAVDGRISPGDPTPTSLVSASAAPASASPASASPSASPSSSSPTAGGTSITPRPAGLRGLLLDETRLPRTRGTTAWRVEHTGQETDEGFGACQLVPMSTLGATASVVRTFTGSATTTAAQVVARFADAESAWRATEVLKSWRSRCASRLGSGATVSPLASVPVAPATGHRYVVATAGELTANERVGIVRRGEVVSIVLYRAGGPATTYAVGREPEALAVKAEAQLLSQ
jgi:hypothetical protein